jgi:hypothetical protein
MHAGFMSQAELGFMLPLFELAGSLADTDEVENMAMGLGEIDPNSDLAADDRDLNGMWVSMVVNNSILASLDHVITLRNIVTRDKGSVTVSAPWTLMRAALESAAIAVWVTAPGLRRTRRAHALRVWHHDFTERQKWEDDTQRKPPEQGKAGVERAADILALATELGIRPTRVATRLAYSDAVADAGQLVGWSREDARALWREASAFAHGRTWPLLVLTSPRDAELIRGGVGMHLTLNEEHLRPMTSLTHDLLSAALIRYAELAEAR